MVASGKWIDADIKVYKLYYCRKMVLFAIAMNIFGKNGNKFSRTSQEMLTISLQQKIFGCNKKYLAATKTIWLQQKTFGCNKKHLAATKTIWLQQKQFGCNKNNLAATKNI